MQGRRFNFFKVNYLKLLNVILCTMCRSQKMYSNSEKRITFKYHTSKRPIIEESYNNFLETVTLCIAGVKQLGVEVSICRYSCCTDRDTYLTVVRPASRYEV